MRLKDLAIEDNDSRVIELWVHRVYQGCPFLLVLLKQPAASTLAPQQQEIRKHIYSTVCGRNPAPVGR